MGKETLDILNELSKKPITELAMSYMEVVVDNIVKDKEIARLNKIIDEFEKDLKKYDLQYLHETREHQLACAIEDMLDTLQELKEEGKE